MTIPGGFNPKDFPEFEPLGSEEFPSFDPPNSKDFPEFTPGSKEREGLEKLGKGQAYERVDMIEEPQDPQRDPRQARVRFFAGADGDFYWHLMGANNEKISGGTEGYRSRQGAERGLKTTAWLLYQLGYADVDTHFPTEYPEIFGYLEERATQGDAIAVRLLEDLQL